MSKPGFLKTAEEKVLEPKSIFFGGRKVILNTKEYVPIMTVDEDGDRMIRWVRRQQDSIWGSAE